MRILMMGTGPFAVPTFRGLLTSQHDVLALITRPVPAPTGRRKSSQPVNPMQELAEARGVTVHAPESIKSSTAIETLRSHEADLLVVCDYGQILSTAALATARLGGINLHGSLLPSYRGAAPINWALYDGVTETGVTVIHMNAGLDAGPCLVQMATRVGPNEDALELEQRLAELGWRSVQEALGMLEDWDRMTPLGVIQDPDQATRAPRLKKTDGAIDWAQGAQQIFDQVRALKPWPGTYTYWHRRKGALRLLLNQVAVDTRTRDHGDPGEVIEADGDRLTIACGQGSLRLLEVQPAGKSRLSAREFLRGYPLAPHDRLQREDH